LRKDRAAELKADKERLVSLSVQKGHADKLKGRIQELATTIATKEVQYENIKQEYDEMVETNARFYEQNKNFREVYIKVEQLTNSKTRCLETAQEIKAKFTELPGKKSPNPRAQVHNMQPQGPTRNWLQRRSNLPATLPRRSKSWALWRENFKTLITTSKKLKLNNAKY